MLTRATRWRWSPSRFVMRQLGVRYLMVTNSAGGVNTEFNPGDLMVINDHLNLTGTNPLLGRNIPEFGTRFPDMTYAYDPELRRLLHTAGEQQQVPCTRGLRQYARAVLRDASGDSHGSRHGR